MVRVVISKPSGQVVAYEPMIDHLVGERQKMLGVEDEMRDSAYIGYGKGGFYFDQPGQYCVRAAYAALDGSQVLSDILTIRVRYPVTRDEDTLADLFMGEDQGVLLYLQGSDNTSLRSGNDAFDEVIDRFGAHPLATYARMVKGINAARVFKTVNAGEGSPVTVRPARTEESIALLSNVTGARVLDPVTEDQVLYSLSCVQEAAGDERGAQDSLNLMSTRPAKKPDGK